MYVLVKHFRIRRTLNEIHLKPCSYYRNKLLTSFLLDLTQIFLLPVFMRYLWSVGVFLTAVYSGAVLRLHERHRAEVRTPLPVSTQGRRSDSRGGHGDCLWSRDPEHSHSAAWKPRIKHHVTRLPFMELACPFEPDNIQFSTYSVLIICDIW